MLPFVRNRPVSLLRCPDGTASQCFFQKHRGDGMPAAVRAVARSDDVGDADYITLSSATGLVGATQMGAIEFHIWGSRNTSLEQPDRIVFDLDPDKGLPFAVARSVAFDLRERLDDFSLLSVSMLSGGKGIHVIVPLRPKAEWEAVKLFSRTVAVMLSDAEPDRIIATMSKAKRNGLILIDWLRNERGSTAIAPCCLRARPGAKVTVPVTWEDLAAFASAEEFDIVSVLRRLGLRCPLQAATRTSVVLDSKVLTRLGKRLAR